MELLKRYLGTLLRTLVGRRQLARVGRYLSNEARFDIPNEMKANGELILQRAVLDCEPAREHRVFFDVGTNVGLWTRALLEQAGASRQVIVHAFEPSGSTRDSLTANLRAWGHEGRVRVNPIALSDQAGTATFFSMGVNAGTSSLHRPADHTAVAEEIVVTETVDNYCLQNAIDRVDLLKIDAEGHDFSILTGCERMLTEQRIDVIQFEYNHRWIGNRRFLQDAFALLLPKQYALGKVTPLGVEFYPTWHFELETFREGNYAAVRRSLVPCMPQVTWWNTPRA